MLNHIKYLFILGLVSMPVLSFASTHDGGDALGNIDSAITTVSTIVNNLVGILMALAVVAFLWGLVRYIFAAGNEDNKEQGKRIMIGGVIALFVMVSVWGIANFLQDLVGIDSEELNAPVGPNDLNPNNSTF